MHNIVKLRVKCQTGFAKVRNQPCVARQGTFFDRLMRHSSAPSSEQRVPAGGRSISGTCSPKHPSPASCEPSGVQSMSSVMGAIATHPLKASSSLLRECNPRVVLLKRVFSRSQPMCLPSVFMLHHLSCPPSQSLRVYGQCGFAHITCLRPRRGTANNG